MKIPGLDKVKAGEGVFFPGRSLRQHLYQRGSHKSLDDGGEDDEIYRDIIIDNYISINIYLYLKSCCQTGSTLIVVLKKQKIAQCRI